MTKQATKNMFIWGVLLWLVGYLLGIVLFFVVPPSMVGWVIMPIGIVFTSWVLLKKISSTSFRDHLLIAITWTLIAVVFDYFFLVKVFNPAGGYYKLDVYLYYALTFALPLVIGLRKNSPSLS